ncbi:DNA-binding transcriptional regulator YdaS, prophage-encoded, Cro superfamily [Pseudomonas sp. LAMO17WK12:I10]|uniref:YdaS family helix-turn-helix protein n=1 Tax=unclassified Pseudomonas TaxID=196821 RepID=UPI000BC79795|nr:MULTISPECIES: YdaS family helix-turn-helix protein [unclassified Pseudomonas]PXX58521.1 DNA-binding transcriptional regulator YdaS (Cro superfamily) [Pseudomonas sp. LAMO17WK12:I9]SNY48697.1 DNA-binding transcriptional regulator YdaS, prophage-encoded, Cro superfamily [Pseudomonas sp. LAMO17WK12:I10]
MTLSEYLKTMDKEGLEVFAGHCGTSVGQLKQVAYGNRRASAGLAVSLDRETSGVIRCEALRPDIDWAYLRQVKK